MIDGVWLPSLPPVETGSYKMLDVCNVQATYSKQHRAKKVKTRKAPTEINWIFFRHPLCERHAHQQADANHAGKLSKGAAKVN